MVVVEIVDCKKVSFGLQYSPANMEYSKDKVKVNVALYSVFFFLFKEDL